MHFRQRLASTIRFSLSFSLKPKSTVPFCPFRFGIERVVVDEADRVITSQGPGTAVEFGLAIAKVLCGKEVAQKVATQMLVPVEV